MSTPVKELPYIAYFLSSSISSCAQLLQAPTDAATARGDDTAVLIHKLKTRISSLLQDKTPEGRFTAIVLVKAVVEAGGREILAGCEPWARGLLGILSKPDPPEIKKLCIITITRIFQLTQPYPSLLREITTPLLPTYIATSINLIRPKTKRDGEGVVTILNPQLEAVLRCFLELIPSHPATFRPFLSRLQAISSSLIGDSSTPEAIAAVARELLISLHFCAPKNTANNEWTKTCNATIVSIHETANRVFRAVIEDWEPSDHGQQRKMSDKDHGNELCGPETDALDMAVWTGLYQGAHRIVALLKLLTSLMCQQTAQQVTLPIGLILEITTRMTLLTVPSSKDLQVSGRLNPEIGRDEREELWTTLPGIHVATLDLLCNLIIVLDGMSLPILHTIVDQTVRVFEQEKRHDEIRGACYQLLDCALPFLGASMTRNDFNSISNIIKSCCKDLLPHVENESEVVKSSFGPRKPQSNGRTSVDPDSFLASTDRFKQPALLPNDSDLHQIASALLKAFLAQAPASICPHLLRSEIDRTAILTQNKEAMLASVLNPPSATKGRPAPPSIMPFLARADKDDLHLEGLLRPRMPVLPWNTSSLDLSANDSDQGSEADNVDTSETGGEEEADLLDHLEHSLDENSAAIRGVSDSPFPAGVRPAPVTLSIPQVAEVVAQSEPEVKIADKRESTMISRDDHDINGVDHSVLRDLVVEPQNFKRPRLGSLSPPNRGSYLQDSDLATKIFVEDVHQPSTDIQPEDKIIETSLVVQRNVADDDDDSDFEMPPINVEPDTDEGEEEDENDAMGQ